MTRRVLIRGSNDIGSAVAHRLFQANYSVLIHEVPQPTTTRRKMSFSDAVYEGQALLAGVEARCLHDLTHLDELLTAHQVIPVIVVDLSVLLNLIRPEILIDARMRKHAQPEAQLNLAQLTIGLGPNFVAGQTTHLAIETAWGDDLGRVIEKGSPRPLAGEPRPIAGHGRDRYVYAPIAGVFRTTYQIGDFVCKDQVIAHIGPQPLAAPLTGMLRGLTRTEVPVASRTKVIEVDPRGSTAVVIGVGERPARIAEGTWQAIQSWYG